MAKMYGYSGKVTGRKGDTVFSVRHGEQILRQYNPIVGNPSTTKQVDARVTLKLMSQLSAVYGAVLAMAREGAKSPRNLFVKQNYPLAVANEGKADIQLAAIQITKSVLAMSAFTADRASATSIAVQLKQAFNYDHVVYVAVEKDENNQLRVLDSVVVDKPASNDPSTFQGSLKYSDKAVAVYAYGINETNAAAKATFGNLTAPTAEDIATLIANRTINSGNVQITKTAGLYMEVGATSGDSSNFERATIAVSVTGSGSVIGAGSYVKGTTVILTANPASGASFLGWYNGNNQVSANTQYSFTIEENTILEARFTTVAGNVTINVSADNPQHGTVNGGGSVAQGSSVTVVATPASGYYFVQWLENGQSVSTSASYTFTANANRTLVAEFAEEQSPGFNVVLTSDPAGASLTGAGSYASGTTVTVQAPASYQDAAFEGWYENGQLVSSANPYSFAISAPRTLVAKFSEGDNGEGDN